MISVTLTSIDAHHLSEITKGLEGVKILEDYEGTRIDRSLRPLLGLSYDDNRRLMIRLYDNHQFHDCIHWQAIKNGQDGELWKIIKDDIKLKKIMFVPQCILIGYRQGIQAYVRFIPVSKKLHTAIYKLIESADHSFNELVVKLEGEISTLEATLGEKKAQYDHLLTIKKTKTNIGKKYLILFSSILLRKVDLI